MTDTKRKCDGCRKRNFIPAPMLVDEVWAKLAAGNELLCGLCMQRRARERGVALSLADLKPCKINLSNFWFDRFARLENEPPANIAEWRELARDIDVVCRREGRGHPWLISDDEAAGILKAYSEWLDAEWAKQQREKKQ